MKFRSLEGSFHFSLLLLSLLDLSTGTFSFTWYPLCYGESLKQYAEIFLYMGTYKFIGEGNFRGLISRNKLLLLMPDSGIVGDIKYYTLVEERLEQWTDR